MFDNLKCITRAAGAAGVYLADRMEHANTEANADDALALSKKITTLKAEGGMAISLFNAFQNGRKVILTIEDEEE